jgi:hypothetical protein
MEYKAKGKLILIGPEQVKSEKFTLKEFVIQTQDEKYPQSINFQISNNNMAQLNGINIGEEVEVSFDIRGNEYNGKYYNKLNAFKVESTLF